MTTLSARRIGNVRMSPCAAVILAMWPGILPPAHASGTATWEMNTYADFVRGRFEGVSLSRDGRLTLAPKVETVFSSDQPIVWSVVQAPDGTLYVATGHRGRVFRIDRTGKASEFWAADEPEVFALAIDSHGALYAGTSPDGKVYRVENGKAAEYFAPGARYIWSMAFGPDGALYVGTGDQGKVFRVESAGKGELYYETGQSHITGLAIDAQGRLLAGTEPNGILYRISAKDKAFVLYDANLPEIRAIVPAPDGTIYAAALGGSVAKRVQSATQAAQASQATISVTSTTPSVTVEAQAGPGADVKPQPEAPKPQTPPGNTPQVTTQFTPAVDVSGVEKSALYRINADNTVETLWSSKDENAYDLLVLKNQILLSTDDNGRIYGLSRDRQVTLILQTNEAEATRLLLSQNSVLAATGNMGRIYRVGERPGNSGVYESPVHDAGTAARWGTLSWRADSAAGTGIRFRTRSGNSAKPDRTWSDWSQPLTNAAGSAISSPNARYIQWKAEFSGPGGATPILSNVSVAYLPQNSSPVLKNINVSAQLGTAAAKPAAQNSAAAYSITVTDTGDAPATVASGTPTQTISRGASQQVTVNWAAEDPDGDRLVYAVYFRAEDESRWKLLKANLHETTLNFDGDVLADGKYYFRVTASDREVNPPETARETELESAPILIDNTPPSLTVGAVRRSGSSVDLEFTAADQASQLRRCEYSLDAATWVPVQAADGVIDSHQERFTLHLENLAPGEHLVVFRAVDAANNTGLAKVVLR